MLRYTDQGNFRNPLCAKIPDFRFGDSRSHLHHVLDVPFRLHHAHRQLLLHRRLPALHHEQAPEQHHPQHLQGHRDRHRFRRGHLQRFFRLGQRRPLPGSHGPRKHPRHPNSLAHRHQGAQELHRTAGKRPGTRLHRKRMWRRPANRLLDKINFSDEDKKVPTHLRGTFFVIPRRIFLASSSA